MVTRGTAKGVRERMGRLVRKWRMEVTSLRHQRQWWAERGVHEPYKANEPRAAVLEECADAAERVLGSLSDD